MKTPSIPRSRRSAFSMIEILAAVAICGILAALLFPAVGKMQLSGRKAGTIANMRQLGTATLAYAGDHQNRLPGPTSQGLWRGYSRSTTGQLSHMLAPYLGLPDQESLEVGDNVIVPQLIDPGYMGFNRKAPSSVPQFVQKIGYPTTSPYAGRRPFGVTESATPGKEAPLTLLDLANLRPEQRWLLCTVDQDIIGLTSSWKSQTPPDPLYGQRFRLYADGRVAPVAANDPN